MEPIPDKFLSGKRFWPQLIKELENAEISPEKYNRLLRRPSPEKPLLTEIIAIAEPEFLHPDDAIQAAADKLEQCKVTSLPVCDTERKILGVITKRNTKKDAALVRDVMTTDKLVTAPEAVSVDDANALFLNTKIKQIYLVDNVFRLKGIVTKKEAEKAEKRVGRKSQNYLTPTISEMPAIFEVLQSCPAKILETIGRSDYLLPGTRDVIETFDKLDSKTIKCLTESVFLTVGEWMYDCVRYNPACRLLLFVEHHIIPKDGQDFYVYDQKLKYRKITKSDVPENEISQWMIGNCKRLPFSTINFDIEQCLDVAHFLKVSFRWLFNYSTDASFYGYRVEVENLYDIWTLATEPVKKMIYNAAKAKV